MHHRTEFHALMVAAIATGTVLTTSAADLGPFAPMLIALGLCAVFFGVTGEAVLWLSALGHWLLQRRAARIAREAP
jgi:hypothetical protein